MSLLKRREIPMAAFALTFILSCFGYYLKAPVLSDVYDKLFDWILIMSTFSIGTGVIALSLYHGRKISRREKGYPMSIVVFASLLVMLTACLALLLYQFIKSPPPPLMEKIRKDYGEKIVDSLGPSKRVGKVTIRVKSMKDLDKVSEETIRPIIHEESIIEKEGLKVKRHILYVLDDDVRYEFTFEEKSPEEPNATKRS